MKSAFEFETEKQRLWDQLALYWALLTAEEVAKIEVATDLTMLRDLINDLELRQAQIAQLVTKIRVNYLDYLTAEEKLSLDLPNDILIRNLVQKIWERYLTNPFDYENEPNFRYLTIQENPLTYFSDTNLGFKDDFHALNLLSDNRLLTECTSPVGFIVTVDWHGANKILLPIDLEKETVFIRAKVKPKALFAVTAGEGMVGPRYSLASRLADQNNFLFLDLNKRRYDPNYELSLSERECLLRGLISSYMFPDGINIKDLSVSNIKKRDTLISKYRAYILKKYEQSLFNGEINEQFFMQEVLAYINEKEGVTKMSF